MGALIIKIFGLIVIAIGIIGICDARDLAKKFFSNADKNTSTKVLRVVGFIIAIIGTSIIYFIE